MTQPPQNASLTGHDITACSEQILIVDNIFLLLLAFHNLQLIIYQFD